MTLVIDAGLHSLVDGDPPAWASAWGEDRFGVHAAFTVGGVTQRMRWIPPGVFDMGSPEDEPGRYDDEGPVHPVTIAYGFWLFDTPCTQALWQAVTKANPSRFRSPTRPVEQVNFNDIIEFIEMVNSIVQTLELSLPSEAEWEYACRAGSRDATYSGTIGPDSEYNSTTLERISWYGGNSGLGFELDNGVDSRIWPNRKYPYTRIGTHPVGLRQANEFGLYDTLGNVWEWCADGWHNDYHGAPADGSAWIEGVTEEKFSRVVRGGSWGDRAHDVRAGRRIPAGDPRTSHPREARAAFQLHFDPTFRNDFLGFRCARIPSASERKRRATRREPA